ncbi:MAG: CapA family protein [Firmicutes bacterium]|nr:CapA family protein [Bacillota bacterium]
MAEKKEVNSISRWQYLRKLQKTRRRRLLLLPLLAVLLAPIFALLWFAKSGPVSQAKQPLKLLVEEQGILIRVGGDIMIAGAMKEQILSQGPYFPFHQVSNFFSSADFSYAGLETPFADTGSPLPGKPLTLRAAPETSEALAYSGLLMLGLASDHMMDYDEAALNQTISLLSEKGIGIMGAGENVAAAAKPYSFSCRGLRIALLDFCENAGIFFSYQYPKTLAAKENEAGIANLEEEAVISTILANRRNHDLIILNLHWGQEYSSYMNTAQRETAHRFIDAGADVIVGRHSHCLQGIEVYNNGLIIYSLGNLLNVQNNTKEAREAALLELELTGLGVKNARLYPLSLSLQGIPELSVGQEAADIMARIRTLSVGMNVTFITEKECLKIIQ